MEKETIRSLQEVLSELKDPRRRQRRAHELVPLLLMSVAAMISGARSLYAIAQWGRERLEDHPELLIAMGLRPGKSPSHATLHRVFRRLDAAAFEQLLGRWLAHGGRRAEPPSSEPPSTEASSSEALEGLAIDGKSLRGIHGEEVPGVHLVAVYALKTQAVLTQATAGDKGTELPAVKAALAQVDLNGKVVMGDALQTQREVCEQIVAQGGPTCWL